MNELLYDYILFNAQLVQHCFRFRSPVQPDSYLSEDLGGEVAAIQDAINKGYRWVRTEGAFAIFEKPLSKPLLNPKALQAKQNGQTLT